MRHEDELAHAERIEAAQRREPIPPRPKPTPEQTYWGRSGAGLDGDPVGDAYGVGSEEGVSGPFAPSPIQWDIDNLEAPLGEAVNAFEPVGTYAEITASLPQAKEDRE